MSIAHLLEDFGHTPEDEAHPMSDLTREELRLEAFEAGFKAGWDDAVKTQQEDTRRISADFAGNLRDLSFTYHEACTGLIEALRPVLSGMVDTVLPALARQSLGPRVVERLEELAREGLEQPFQIVTAPANLEALEGLLSDREDLPAVLRAEPSLGDGQVHIRFGATEHEIDLDSVLAEISAAMTGFLFKPQKESA